MYIYIHKYIYKNIHIYSIKKYTYIFHKKIYSQYIYKNIYIHKSIKEK